jgi:hypothetical protein
MVTGNISWSKALAPFERKASLTQQLNKAYISSLFHVPRSTIFNMVTQSGIQSIMKSPRSILSPSWSGFLITLAGGDSIGFGISFGGSGLEMLAERGRAVPP